MAEVEEFFAAMCKAADERVGVTLDLLRQDNGLVAGHVEATAKLPPWRTAGTLSKVQRRQSGQTDLVFQQFALLPWRTVRENVGFGLELRGVPTAERKKIVDEQLALVGLDNWADKYSHELSGGMQQRVGLARAFAIDGPILLMDEPFSALDPLIRTRLQDELLEFQARLKKTILFVSHDLDEAFRIGNRIAIMEGGRIIQCGTPQEIVRNPVNQYVADFVQNMNPINMLTAADVMRAGAAAPNETVSATATPTARLTEVLDAMTRQPGVVGVIDNGAVIGVISAQDVVSGLTRHRRV